MRRLMRPASCQQRAQPRRRFLQLRHRAGGGEADEARRSRRCRSRGPGVTATWARFIDLEGEVPAARDAELAGGLRCSRPRRRRRRRASPAPCRPSASSCGMNQSRRALNSARRRSYSAMLSGSKQASAACCATVLAQMKRFCASRSITGTSASGTTSQPRRQPVMLKYLEKLLMLMTWSSMRQRACGRRCRRSSGPGRSRRAA